jgi:hypothetical protein
MLIKILYIVGGEAIAFAASELKRVLGRMDLSLEVSVCAMTEKTPARGLWLGVCDALGVEAPVVADPALDDGYVIDVVEHEGVIAGVNPRSNLLAVYRYLRELGCAWIRPGESGELIPQRPFSGTRVWVREAASYRHRGVCIEGAASYDHVRDMVLWLPRIGLNAYFNQFQTPFTFYDRWYQHEKNPLIPAQAVTRAEVDGFVRDQLNEIRKRGLMYHAVGHGWTCAPFGFDSVGWYPYEEALPEGVEAFLALVDGKRTLYQGIPLNTNLCYSNRIVRSRVIDAITQYCLEHPDVNFVHFWLADAMNNQCECDECRKMTPSDRYVQMLNELDDRMTGAGIRARVVFLIYYDLMWSPLVERIQNPDRFLLMFAPITRTYTTAYVDSDLEGGEIPPFCYNRLTLPRSVGENVAFLRQWQKVFAGDSFVFDYHLWIDHLRDMGYAQISRVLFRDMQGLKQLNLNGMVSCQSQRAFFPTALPMLLMADALWNRDADYEACVARHYRDMFGEDGPNVRAYLERISSLADSAYMRHEKPEVSEEARQSFAALRALILDFSPVIQANLAPERALPDAVLRSYRYLQQHAELLLILARALEHKAAGDKDKAAAVWEDAVAFVRLHEEALHPVLDLFMFLGTMEGCILESGIRMI